MSLTIPLHPRDGYGLVPVTLTHAGSSVDVSLLLDTGAARTTLDLRLAERLRLPPQESGRSVDIHGVAGVVPGTRLAVDPTLFGEIRLVHEVRFMLFPSVRVGIGRASQLCEGLFGNDLLRAAGLRAVVDVPKGRAMLAVRPLR